MLKSLSKKQEGIYRSVSLWSQREFSREQVPLEAFLVTWNNPYVFAKGNLFLINLIYFYDEFPRSVDVVDSAYFEFSKALSLICHSVFVRVLWFRWMDY